MNKTRCSEEDCIDFLVGTPKVYTCTEAARVQPVKAKAPSHDSLDLFGNSVFCFSGKEKIFERPQCTKRYMRTLMKFLTQPEDKRLSFRRGLLTRLLQREGGTSEMLWKEAEPFLTLNPSTA